MPQVGRSKCDELSYASPYESGQMSHRSDRAASEIEAPLRSGGEMYVAVKQIAAIAVFGVLRALERHEVEGTPVDPTERAS